MSGLPAGENLRIMRIFECRPEILIAATRLALILFCLAAVYLVGAQAGRYPPAFHGLLWLYAAMAAVWLLITQEAHGQAWLQLGSHAVDVAVVAALMGLTSGVASPFFILFTFLLISATLRWNWRGAIATTVVLTVVVLAMSSAVFGDPDTVALIVVRSGYLLATGAMFGYLGAARVRTQTRLAQLVHWPEPPIAGRGPAPSLEALRRLAMLMGARGVVVIWEEDDEPAPRAAAWEGGEVLREDAAELGPEAVFRTAPASGRVDAAAFQPSFVARWPFRECLTAPFQLSVCAGRVFLLDPAMDWEDDRLLTGLAAVRLGVDLEHEIVRRRLELAAKVSERASLARDLHDGLLQTLTAATVHLKLAARRAPAHTASALSSIRRSLGEEQRLIRRFVEENRPRTSLQGEAGFDLCPLREAVGPRLRRLQKQWDCAILYEEDPAGLSVSTPLAGHVGHLIAEAVANAVRHGGADEVRVRVARLARGGIEIMLGDDGRGFPGLSGEYGPSALKKQALRPRSLISRVDELGGELSLQTGAGGSLVRIRLPDA